MIDGQTPALLEETQDREGIVTWEDLHSEVIPTLQLIYKAADWRVFKNNRAPVSVRTLMAEAMIDESELPDVLQAIVDGGWEYGLDIEVVCVVGRHAPMPGREALDFRGFLPYHATLWTPKQIVAKLATIHPKVSRT